MRMPELLRFLLLGYAQGVMESREPDVKIGGDYVHRWMLLPKRNPLSRLFNVYIHKFMRDDEDGALHDHEPDNVSLILAGAYVEHFHREPRWVVKGDDGKDRYLTEGFVRSQGDVVGRLAGTPHRITLFDANVSRYGYEYRPDPDPKPIKQPVITMFVQGPRRRHWGFHCTTGWKPWEEYIDVWSGYGDRSGKGCGS